MPKLLQMLRNVFCNSIPIYRSICLFWNELCKYFHIRVPCLFCARGGGGTCYACIQGCVCHVFGFEFHLKAIFLGLKFADMNFPLFWGKNFQQLPFSLNSIM